MSIPQKNETKHVMEAKLAPGDGYKYLLLPALFLLLSRCPDMIPMDLNRAAPKRSNRMSSHPTRCFLPRNVTVPKWKNPETYISALAQRSSCTIDDDECNSTSKSQSPLQEFSPITSITSVLPSHPNVSRHPSPLAPQRSTKATLTPLPPLPSS